MPEGIGCDLVEVERIERALKKPGFSDRVFTECERARIKEKGVQTAAGCWAAKEAVSKALGTGFAGFGPRDIEVQPNAAGMPEVLLHRGAQRRAEELRVKQICLSISHTKDVAMAVALLERE